MKALILAAGKGSRLATLPDGENKCMIRVNGQPLLYYHMLRAVDLQAEQIIIVIGHAGETIKQHFGSYFQHLPISYVWQTELTGPVSAIDIASGYLDHDFILMLADEYFVHPNHIQMQQLFTQTGLFGLCGIIEGQPPQSIQKTYAVLADDNGRIYQLTEKPEHPAAGMKGTGLCFLRKEILQYIPHISAHQQRREKDLPALIQQAIDNGHEVHALSCCERFYNLNLFEDCELLNAIEQADISMPERQATS